MEFKLLKIINHFGIENQLIKLEEEFIELQDEITEVVYNQNVSRETLQRLRDEAGDIINIVDGMLLKVGVSPDESIRKQHDKIDRTCIIIDECKKNKKNYEEVREYVR